MKITIEISETVLDSYSKVREFMKEHPTRKDWEGVLRNFESEIAEKVLNQAKK